MKAQKQAVHMIDFIFTIALFGVFTASALLAVIIGANVYKSTTKNMAQNYDSRTSMAYITEKIRQFDESDSIQINEIDGTKCLMFYEYYQDATYITYIYCNQDQLMELSARDSLGFDPSAGETIIDIQSFDIESVKDNLFELTITDASGLMTNMFISIQSESKGGDGT